MLDMMVLAFQADLTRVITLPFADEQSNQSYPWAGANVPHHGTSHHMGDPAKMAMLAKINVYHLQKVELPARRNSTPSRKATAPSSTTPSSPTAAATATATATTTTTCPSSSSAKRAAPSTPAATSRPTNVPINNLWLSMLDHAGAKDDKLGDSTGKLSLT